MKIKKSKINHRKLIVIELIILCICAIIGLYSLANNNPSIKNAIILATTKKPETFTELYFEDHINLPKTITRWKQYSFTFTIHNFEYQDMDYSYEVYLSRDDQKIKLDEGKINLKADEFTSVDVNFGPLQNFRSKIVVELTNKNQSIHFWMEEI